MDFEQKIIQHIEKLTAAEGIPSPSILVEIPKDPEMGDFAVPCFHFAKALRKAPAQIASHWASQLSDEIQPEFSQVTAAGPYLNFSVDSTFLAQKLVPAVEAGTFQKEREKTQNRYMVEFSQPNTHKAFHVGHMRNVALGEALVHALRWYGHDVIAANYIGDVGTHIAKCLWYYLNFYKGEVPSEHRGEFLGEMYTRATEMLDFSLLSRCPILHVEIVQVLGITPLADHSGKALVRFQTQDGQKQVICGGTHYAVGDYLAWAKPGSRIEGRLVGEKEIFGHLSQGMLCSERELGLSDDGMKMALFPKEAAGMSVAEFYRVPDALAPETPVEAEILARTAAVQKVLQDLEAEEPHIHQLWQETKAWSMDEFMRIYDWVHCQFDHIFYESDVGDEGKKIVKEFYEKGVLVRSEGAIGADLSPYNLPFLLLLKSDGTGLYATKDLALARRKFEEFGIDHSIYVVDTSQSLHFQQVFKTLELMGFEQAKDCYHLAYGLVVLPDGKMSSRQGNIILFSQLKSQLTQEITQSFLEKYRGEWSDQEIEASAHAIALATIKYGMLNQDSNKNIVFDWAEWTAKSGNTGPYMMYAYARTRSILREAGFSPEKPFNASLLTHPCEKQVMLAMLQFPSVVQRVALEYKPNLLCPYLFNLAKEFSRMYDSCPVLKASSEELKWTRTHLVQAVGLILKQGLALLGIQTLERM